MSFYAVANGFHPGIYESWEECKENIEKYNGAVYKKFSTKDDAKQFIQDYNNSHIIQNKSIQSSLHTLTKEQRSVIFNLLKGENIFLTGGGGVGKSYLLSTIYKEYPYLKSNYQKYNNSTLKQTRIQMCALTGCASLLLGHKAKTLHSWAGIGLGKGTVSELYVKISKNGKAKKNWLCTDLLIIDEISMMTSELFDKLNEIGKKIRRNNKPFGGIQLLLVGDFYQLPPVNKTNEATIFAFESSSWNNVITCSIELTVIQRQKDEIFQNILKEARIGSLTKTSCNIIKQYQGRDWKSNKIRPTLLFPRRAEVDMINDSNIRALKGRRFTYKAHLVYDGKVPEDFSENSEQFQRVLQSFDYDAPYSKDLELIQDAQIMLIANIDPDNGLVNGSRGVIVDFCPQTNHPIVEFINGIKKTIGYHTWSIDEYDFVSRSQIPLRLAYAVTIHRSQGCTLDSALVDIGMGTFEFGQAYVALSRVRSLDSLFIHDFHPNAFRSNPKVNEFYKNIIINTFTDDDDKLLEFISSNNISTNKEMNGQIIINKLDDDSKLDDNKYVDKIEKSDNWLFNSIPDTWKLYLSSCENKLQELSTILSTKSYLPKNEDIWSALHLTSLNSIKVVILGQDPYPTPGNAHGLAFSVLPDVRPLPPSLKNIYKELHNDIGFIIPNHGHLESWAKNGVMLLNTVLTVEAGSPQSHSKIGWEHITDQIIRSIAANTQNVIFVLWGKSAQTKKSIINLFLKQNNHRIFESAHPSPLSASKGFFGSKPFSTINKWLEECKKEPINWQFY